MLKSNSKNLNVNILRMYRHNRRGLGTIYKTVHNHLWQVMQKCGLCLAVIYERLQCLDQHGQQPSV